MRATEVLKQYAAGRRDFSGENLRGQSFKGKDLSGANFSKANIRGTNFSNTILRNATFSEAKAGLQMGWMIAQLSFLMMLSVVSGFISTFGGVFAGATLVNPNPVSVFAGFLILVIYAVFIFIIIHQGIEAAFGTIVIAVTSAITVAVAVTGTFVIAGTVTSAITVVVAGTAAIVGAIIVTDAIADTNAVAIAVTFAVVVMLVSGYISWGALKADRKYVLADHAFLRSVISTVKSERFHHLKPRLRCPPARNSSLWLTALVG